MKKLILTTVVLLLTTASQSYAIDLQNELTILQNCQFKKNCHENDTFSVKDCYFNNCNLKNSYLKLFNDFYDKKITIDNFLQNFYLLKNKEEIATQSKQQGLQDIENILLITR